MQVSTSLLFSSAISRMHRGDLMRLASSAGLWPKVENNAIYCVFFCSRSRVTSYLGAILWFVVSHIFQSLQRKQWWPLYLYTHLKTVPVKDNVQVSSLEELSQRIDLFWANSRTDVWCVFTSHTLCWVLGNCQDNMQMSWLTNRHIIVESKSAADLNEEGHQFCFVPVKGTKMSWFFIHKSMAPVLWGLTVYKIQHYCICCWPALEAR